MAILPFQINPIIVMVGIHDRRVGEFLLSLRRTRGPGTVNRRLLDDLPAAYSNTTISSTVDLVPPSHTRHQIPIRNSNNPRRQHLEALRQAVHNQPGRRENSSTSSSSQVHEEDEILKHLTKETYNPVNPAPKSTLLRSLSFYYRNKTPGSENARNSRDLPGDEEDKRCSVCLEDFEPKETVMLTPCKHMFHEECIVPWLKSKGQCPVCRFVILKPAKQDSSPTNGSNPAGDMRMNDLFTLELLSVVRAMEETFLFGYPRRM
ncbi:PREDICTED: E3 ubiquitin-protein ligase ATL4-like isoform X2 [Camelina sativa]|uniref:E3 ubiquitin-protein ligase ATL4-like isoform X2 n=1 Tax=Camelina sativa TaxID=90675 RepID=A0ABM1RN31_CAMSA|nr:PREDICTED: E3 ubiquitin-protein ligase ATL4-like isoform X2 [Camelina sativa]